MISNSAVILLPQEKAEIQTWVLKVPYYSLKSWMSTTAI
jgi:hypothetical protein